VEGWPRDLGLRPVDGADRTGDPGGEVRTAIGVERQVQSGALAARVDAVALLDPDEGLWRARLTLPAPRGRPLDWRGASLSAELIHGGPIWTATILDLDGPGAVLFAPPPVVLEAGDVLFRPFDFLRAPWELVQRPSLRAARARYVELLEAAAGWSCGRPGVRGQLGPWGWSWAAVWGPPGTGKTHSLVERVLALLKRSDERVLVLSTTNRATDEIALRLAYRCPDGVLRVGQPDVLAYRARDASHVLPQPEERLDALIAAERSLDDAATPGQRARARRHLGELRRTLPSLADVLIDDEPRCVVTTLHAALGAVVHEACAPFHDEDRAPFTTVFVDEAGLVSRASAAAVALLAARQVVLVGDPQQLSPICVASRSLEPRVKRWLASSALQDIRDDDDHVHSLTVQHRMHPEIRGVVSALSYGDRLDDAPSLGSRRWAGGGRLAQLPRALWLVLDRFPDVAHAAAAERGPEGSWLRRASLSAFEELLGGYDELRGADGLFLAPYRAQAAAAAAIAESSGSRWRASTIHAQQGAEADVVFFDLVRGTGWAPPEFRRLVNVALSRARHQLFFCATEAELGAGWLRSIRGLLPRFVVERSQLLRLTEDGQQGLFGGPRTPLSEGPHRAGPTGEDRGRSAARLQAHPPIATSFWPDDLGDGSLDLEAEGGGAADPPALPSPGLCPPPLRRVDPARLGVQIAQHRAARRTLTRAQAQLVDRNLKDLGPRVVRGVAGSGKTIVLARWAAAELETYPDRSATVLFGNLSLQPHLDDLLRQAWAVTTDGAPYPEDRVRLLHVGRFLADVLREQGVPRPEARWDLSAHLAALGGRAVSGPRFELLYIDEAQDLGHDVLGFVLSLVDRRDGAFPVRVFYDNAQNIYGRSTPTWAEFGLDVRGRSAVLRESFRSTRQAMELALNVLDPLKPLASDPDLRELIQPRTGPPLLHQRPGGWWHAAFAVVRGEAPSVELFASRAAERAALGDAVRGWIEDRVRPRDVRVLALSRGACAEVADALRRAGVEAVFLAGQDFDPRDERVVVTTPQSFKGYEAEVVAVVGLEGFAPAGAGVLAEAMYVAMTRARTLMRVSAVRVELDHPGAPIVAALERAAALRPDA
jgi:hypothetical protein